MEMKKPITYQIKMENIEKIKKDVLITHKKMKKGILLKKLIKKK